MKARLITTIALALLAMPAASAAPGRPAHVVKCVNASTGPFCDGYKQICVLDDWTDVFGEVHKSEPWNDGHDAMHCWLHDHPGYPRSCKGLGCT